MNERVDEINTQAVKHMERWLKLVAEDKATHEDELLSQTYGGLVALALLGYSPSTLAADAERGAQRLMALAQEHEDAEE